MNLLRGGHERPGAPALQTGPAPALALVDVDHAFGDGSAHRLVLRSFSATFAPGRFTCISGPSGCGKTTILSLLSSVVPPQSGEVVWGDTVISALSYTQRNRWRRQNVGIIFQTSRLIDVFNVRDHIGMASRVRASGEAGPAGAELLQSLGMHEHLDRFPRQLSGGEKQRVALAQALCFGPSVVLADEPTAALDHPNSDIVAAALRRYAETRGAVVVAVSHDDAMMAAAHDVLTLVKP